MAATYTKQKLSGSTNGKGIKVAATGSAGTSVHTAVSGTTDWDEVWIYVMNSDEASVDLTLEFGGTSDPDNLIKCSVPALSGLQLVVPGLVLNNGQVVAAYADITNVLVIYGFVNRIDT
jgi:hypothetical protein